jgi:hypothetical protein
LSHDVLANRRIVLRRRGPAPTYAHLSKLRAYIQIDIISDRFLSNKPLPGAEIAYPACTDSGSGEQRLSF